jgi:hypothetical protein
VVPVHYDLVLTPDIYAPNPAQFSLSGKLVARVTCKEVTSQIVLHAVGLDLSRDGMRVTSQADGGRQVDVIVIGLFVFSIN